MKTQKVYILLYNNSVQIASKDLKILAMTLEVQCTSRNMPAGHSYVQVTRIIHEKQSYMHSPAVGHTWEIIHRELLYTRRKGRAAVQRENTNQQINP